MIHYGMPGACYVTLHYSGLCRATCPLHCQITTASGSSPYRHCSLETGPAHHILRTTLRYRITSLRGYKVLRMGGYHWQTMHHVTAVQSQADKYSMTEEPVICLSHCFLCKEHNNNPMRLRENVHSFLLLCCSFT